MHLHNRSNDYVTVVGPLFAEAPKTVWAAVALSFAIMACDANGVELDLSESALRPAILKEWAALHAAGIVPQKPPAV